MPWLAKAVAFVVAGYALSPIDLILDFVPVLGYVDNVVIVPLGILLAMKLIPPEILAEHRGPAARPERPLSSVSMIAIIAIWVGVGVITVALALRQVA